MKSGPLLLFLVVFACAAHAQFTPFAGPGGSLLGDGGPAPSGRLRGPSDVCFDAAGNAYISDFDDNRVRKVNLSGIITTAVGTGYAGYSGDGAAATAAKLNSPKAVAFDRMGNLYVADCFNGCVRRISPAGIISTFAGTGTASPFSYSGDGGPATAATIGRTSGIAVDTSNNVYISDINNSVIRKVNTLGIISTFAGTGVSAFGGDFGPATAAMLCAPNHISFDAAGNLYVADAGNSRIRKISTAGIITTVAGNGAFWFSGDGGPAIFASLYAPTHVVADSRGNLYIADKYNSRVRKVDSSGIISTIAGHAITVGSISSYFGLLESVVFNSAGNLFVVDATADIVYEASCAPPTVTPVFGPHSGCVGTLFFLNDTSWGGYWQSRNVGIATIDSAGIGLGITAGVDTIIYFTRNLCATDTAAVSFVVTVNALPACSSIVGPAVVCAGTSITLTDSTAGGVWGAANTNAIISSGVVTGITPGLDTITYTVHNSCGDVTRTKVVNVITCPALSVGNGLPGGAAILLYPNPASDEITIASATELGDIVIVDLLGKTVSQMHTSEKSALIDISSWQHGVYLVKVGGILSGKFVRL